MPPRPAVTTAETGSAATVTARLSGDWRSSSSLSVGAMSRSGEGPFFPSTSETGLFCT